MIDKRQHNQIDDLQIDSLYYYSFCYSVHNNPRSFDLFGLNFGKMARSKNEKKSGYRMVVSHFSNWKCERHRRSYKYLWVVVLFLGHNISSFGVETMDYNISHFAAIFPLFPRTCTAHAEFDKNKPAKLTKSHKFRQKRAANIVAFVFGRHLCFRHRWTIKWATIIDDISNYKFVSCQLTICFDKLTHLKIWQK